MKRMLILAVAVTAMVFANTNDASAQSYNNGYGFGTGVNQAFGGHGQRFGAGCFAGGFGLGFGNVGIVDRVSEPPYFAKFPPVYYSGIVRRPYGISPYAAPAGITPVEMTVPAAAIAPLTVKNPFVNRNSQPVSAAKDQPVKTAKPSLENKTTRVVNPFFVAEPIVKSESAKLNSVLLANAKMPMQLVDAVEIAFFK